MDATSPEPAPPDAPDASKPPPPPPPHIDLEESVAGEEDPGASIDLGVVDPAPKPG